MKKINLFKYSIVLCFGILLGFTLLSATKSAKVKSSAINTEEAKMYFQNYRQMMGYDRNQDNTSGYFDISKETLNLMLQNLKDGKFDKARVYMGTDSSTKPTSTVFLMNGMTVSGGKEYKEVNTGSIMTVIVKNGNNECPHYCDIMTTVLGAPQALQSPPTPPKPAVKKKRNKRR